MTKKKECPVFLLLGPEKGEKNRFINKLLKEKKNEHPDLEVYRFYPHDSSMDDILVELNNSSLFSTYKVVSILDVDQIKDRKEIKALAEYCQEPKEGSLLLLVSQNVKISATLDKAVPKENKKIFWELFENQKKAWVIKFFSQSKIQINDAAADFLLEMIENNTYDLKVECKKLVLFYGPGKTLSIEELEDFVYHSKEENVFTLFEKMVQLDLQQSLEVLNKIYLSGDFIPVSFFGGLLWQYKRLLALKALLLENYSLEEACIKINIRGKKNKNIYSSGCKHYSLGKLQQIISLFQDYNSRVRSAKSEIQEILIQLFIYKILKPEN